MKQFLILLVVILIAGCQMKSGEIDRGDYRVDRTVSSNNHNPRIRFLVLHYTATNDSDSLRLLTSGDVSAHYLITARPETSHGKPLVMQLVPEAQRAWHAGVSHWQGRDNLNDTSVGIEIVNPGFSGEMAEKKWHPFHPAQIELAARLARDIIQRYQLTPDNVIGHSDIAPLRKFDPGPLFPWESLARLGIGAWPDNSTVVKHLAGRMPQAPASVAKIQAALANYGYKIPQTGQLDADTLRTISVFQMHFRPSDFSGKPDAQTEAIAMALVEKYRS
jgi:N-acetylmuramoyl-L-alanine amidase